MKTDNQQTVNELEQELIDLALDVICSYGYEHDGVYSTGGHSTQEEAFDILMRYNVMDENGKLLI